MLTRSPLLVRQASNRRDHFFPHRRRNVGDLPAVARDLREFGAREVELGGERRVLIVDGVREIQRIVRAHRATNPRAHQSSDRMLTQRRHDFQPHVADRTQVERHPTLRRESDDCRVFDRANSMLNPVDPEFFDRFAHAVRSPKFPRVTFRNFSGGPQSRPHLGRSRLGAHRFKTVQVDASEIVQPESWSIVGLSSPTRSLRNIPAKIRTSNPAGTAARIAAMISGPGTLMNRVTGK
jgi:hypothetical protein